jgi:hypothetical protein
MKGDGFLPARGNYRELKSFRKAEIVYDVTNRFCRRFLQRGDRTIDQMVQAARSGKQNIVEGSPIRQAQGRQGLEDVDRDGAEAHERGAGQLG